MKPKHQGGYTHSHADLCERTLVTLLRGLGPYKHSVYLAGGLVPRYLIARSTELGGPPMHVGTTDVDLVLDLEILAGIEAYRNLERNLAALGFERGRNEHGQAQHHSWRKPIEDGVVVVDLLCDAAPGDDGRIMKLTGEGRLSALKIPGIHLVTIDHVPIEITAELLNDRGMATEIVRVAGIASFIVLKALAYEDRFEEKDAYDIIYCLMNYGDGPRAVAAAYRKLTSASSSDLLIKTAIEILRARFSSDATIAGARKDGPTSYARFLTDPGRPSLSAQHRQDAAAVVELFLAAL